MSLRAEDKNVAAVRIALKAVGDQRNQTMYALTKIHRLRADENARF